MKFQVEHDALAEAVAWVARALPSRPVVPVLSGLRLDAAEGLTLSCFDYELSATTRLPADIAEPGTALVPGRLLAEITRSLPGQPAEFRSDGDEVTLSCGSTWASAAARSPPSTVPASGGAGGSSGYSAVGRETSANSALPQLRVTSSPSERNSAGCPGRLRVISASSRPGTSAVPGSAISAGNRVVAESS